MSCVPTSLRIMITFASISSVVVSYPQDYNYYPFEKKYTDKLKLKQGYIKGVIVEPLVNSELPPVQHFRGIPYAAPPIGDLRFMPPRDAPSWENLKYADNFGPACPQTFPDVTTMSPKRKEEFLRLKEYLMNESEDCLYLNVYAPHNGNGNEGEKYPVIVFIHGESFEWNSGNPYDGSVLASYGKVVVVTFNFRLGMLGFLKTGTGDDAKSNFGLVDQIAALVWVRENIAVFGGDPSSVTLLGHGTGAVSASLLTLSPMVVPGNQLLFHRAILMGGTALADWALASNPQDVTYQVARTLDCPIDDEFESCLRSKRLDEIKTVSVFNRPYATRFGPVVDSRIVTNDPLYSMTNYTSIFRRFELMYGVTEMESVNFLGPIAVTHGMLQRERDQELKNYLRFSCATEPQLCVTKILTEYTGNVFLMDDEAYSGGSTGNAAIVRDSLLDILSDARTLSPLIKMAQFHSTVNPQSYMYVFTHKTRSKEYLRNKTASGDELPYVFGVPLDGNSFHFVDRYTELEVLFSEVIMTYICNFAYRGNPNQPRKNEYYTSSYINWSQFDVDWPEFGGMQRNYLQLDIPIRSMSHYRTNEVEFWNKVFPDFLEESKKAIVKEQPVFVPPPTVRRPKGTPPPFIFGRPVAETKNPSASTKEEPKEEVFGTLIRTGTERPDNNIVYGTVVNSPSEHQKALTVNLIVISGCAFLFLNFLLFMALYYKCYRMKKNRGHEIISNEVDGDLEVNLKKNKYEENRAFVSNGCGLMKMISKSSRSDDAYEAVKIGNQNNSSKQKLTRQLSNSTIDAHTKVRDWITQDIIKYTPKSVRKPTLGNIQLTTSHKSEELISLSNETPTRPVSPELTKIRPILIKQNSLPLQKPKKPDKISVAIDATPSGRGPSVLAQKPIELMKSLRRSATMDDFSPRTIGEINKLTKSANNLISSGFLHKPTLVKIEHTHSKSDPVQDINKIKKLRTFDPQSDVNVTSRDDEGTASPMSPEESLMTIKRRNYPKVLPDYPTKEALAQKRRSMPVAPMNIPLNRLKVPPAPPIRTTSTLGRKPQASNSIDQLICTSAPVLIEESSSSPEPEITYNNLYVGPLIPKKQESDEQTKKEKQPVAIITTNPENPLKKPEPKTVIRPKMVKQLSDPKGRIIPRVTATDNLPEYQSITPIKTEKKSDLETSSSSETSQESDTGTVVNKTS